jgi:hypothetical protein
MKAIIISFLLIFSNFIAKADQLEWVTKSQAEQAVNYLKKQSELILWCACCTDDIAERVMLKKVYYEKVENSDYYQVFIEGSNEMGDDIKKGIDLAYVHVKIGKNAVALGRVLKFKCDPCTKPFAWAFQR